VELDPFSVESRFFLGAAYYRLNLYDRAEELLQVAMDLDEGNTDAQLLLINVYARQARYEPALELANAFLEAHPDAPERDAIERVRSQLEDALRR
jgi:lipopolysaccharide biosynthesis regulator YciM